MIYRDIHPVAFKENIEKKLKLSSLPYVDFNPCIFLASIVFSQATIFVHIWRIID